MREKEINKKLFAGEWIFSECERMSYKLDKQGKLIFNCTEGPTDDEKTIFTCEALIHMGVEESRAKIIAAHGVM